MHFRFPDNADQGFFDNSSKVTTTGSLPINSEIKPYFRRSSALNGFQYFAPLLWRPLSGVEPNGLFADPSLNDFIETVKGAAANEQYICGIKLYEISMGSCLLEAARLPPFLRESSTAPAVRLPADITGNGGISVFLAILSISSTYTMLLGPFLCHNPPLESA